MYQPRVFCVKLQLHFGGDIHEISVPAYNGAEPTIMDLMTVVERDFRVPRALQNLVFHGQELHPYPGEPLSRFGIKNLGAIRLVGRMAPPEMIEQINSQYNVNLYQPNGNYQSCTSNCPTYDQQTSIEQKPSVGTQYDPPQTASINADQPPPPTPNKEQLSERPSGAEQIPPPTPNSTK